MYCNNELQGYSRRPRNIPENPYIYQNEGFLDFNDWLGAKKEYTLEQIASDINLSKNEVISKAKEKGFILDENSIISIPLSKRIIESLS